MPLDPQIAAVLSAAPEGLRLPTGDPDEAREVFEKICRATARYGEAVEVASTEDIEVDGAEGPLRARIYRPDASVPTPTLVFFHGGGWVIGSIETHDLQTRLLCRDAQVTVLSVEYRLAPENRWPAGLEDALAATRWALAHVGELGGDRTRVAVGGDSAGGNLAAIVAQELREEIAAQLLIYPGIDFAGSYPSRSENGEGYFLTHEEIGWFSLSYLPSLEVIEDPRVSPIRGELAGAPPAVIVTAEYDPLRDEGNAYADALARVNVPVIHRCFDGMIHGFFGWGPISGAAANANRTVCDDLRAVLESATSRA
jgi:acetyl esterase